MGEACVATGTVVCYEGHELSADGHQTGVIYEASVVERPRKCDFVPLIKKAPAGGELRRLRGLEAYQGSKPQAGAKLRVWMRTLMAEGDIGR